jgi:hypothetical protein
MPLFHHPCLVRGVVYTPSGAFVVSRGIVDVPEDVGQSFGWVPVGAHPEAIASSPLTASSANRSKEALVAD